MKEHTKWKISDIGQWLKNAFLAAIHGQLLQRPGISKYFIHIVYTFFLFWVSIWLSLKIEKTMTKVEDNRKVLSDIEIQHAQKTVELASLGRMNYVLQMLQEKGSALNIPEKPAERIK